MKPVSDFLKTEVVKTLGEFSLSIVRCAGCGMDLPDSTHVEAYSTEASNWIVAQCPMCNRCTPVKLEAA